MFLSIDVPTLKGFNGSLQLSTSDTSAIWGVGSTSAKFDWEESLVRVGDGEKFEEAGIDISAASKACEKAILRVVGEWVEELLTLQSKPLSAVEERRWKELCGELGATRHFLQVPSVSNLFIEEVNHILDVEKE